MNGLRPTLFLAQLSNLLAGNIAIVHGVSGTSRTFMGEEAAGVDAARIALARIAAGQSDIALIGGAYNGERQDLLLLYEFGGFNLKDKFAPVWARQENPGFALGSAGAFLVIESKAHAQARGAKPYARLTNVVADLRAAQATRRGDAIAGSALEKAWRRRRQGALITGATGAEPVTSEEKAFLSQHPDYAVRATGTMFGQTRGSAVSARVSRWRRFRSRAVRCFRPTIRPDWRLKCPSLRPRLWWWVPAIGRARAWLWSRRSSSYGSTGGEVMTAPRDKFGRPIVVVTGMGVITSLGAGKTDNWTKLTAGKSGIRTVTRFPIDGLKTTMAGTVDFIAVEPFSSIGLSERMAEMATEEALEQSGIGRKGDFPGPLFLAVAPVETEWPQRLEAGRAVGKTEFDFNDVLRVSGGGKFAHHHRRFLFGSVAGHLAETFGTKGSPISLSTACASGATAIQLGVEAIRRGEADAALCVATDSSVNAETLVRFSLLSALSTHNDAPQTASKPFSKNRDGFVMAEGAGALVLESYEAAVARGATILGVVAGCGELTNSFHRTRSSPDGKPIVGCVRKSLADAGMTSEQIDYINAHGTSTPENDKMEYLGISTVFGERAKQVPVSSNKSMVGHTISAAGAVEAVFSLLTLEHQRIPPTINYDIPDPAIPFDVVPNKARDARVTAVMSNSFGFGGQNASLILTREPI